MNYFLLHMKFECLNICFQIFEIDTACNNYKNVLNTLPLEKTSRQNLYGEVDSLDFLGDLVRAALGLTWFWFPLLSLHKCPHSTALLKPESERSISVTSMYPCRAAASPHSPGSMRERQIKLSTALFSASITSLAIA